MIKKSELIFILIKLITDYILLILGAVAAYFLRFGEAITAVRPVIFNLPLEKFFWISIVVAIIWLIFFFWSGLYRFKKYKITDELSKVILACSTGMTAVVLYMFFVRELFESRFIVLTAWILSIVFIMLGRMIIRLIQNGLYKKGWGVHKVILIGKNSYTDAVKEAIEFDASLGLKIIKHYEYVNSEIISEIEKLHKKQKINEIIQADPNISRKDSLALLNFTKYNHIIFKYVAGPFEARATNIETHMIAGLPVIEIKKTPLDGWKKIIKRTSDIIGAFLLIIVFSPVLLATAIVIKLNSRGPIIYKNERIGQRGKKFNVYKFRSMFWEMSTGPDAPGGEKALELEKKLIKEQGASRGALYKIKKDPRVTPVGKFIRKFSIDELPQFFNVLAGSMSLVGPRPHQPREVDNYTKEQLRTLDIKPGITGIAQISGRSDLPFDEEAKMDIFYVENWSLKLDFWILLKTPWAVVKGKNAI
ncbi:MAG: sugar transferase [Patescibacteria group bacterium]